MARRIAGARGGRRGVVYRFGDQPLVRFADGTFTRTSEGSYYVAAPGGAGSTFIDWALSNVMRMDSVDGLPLALFEGSQTNICQYSEDLNQASWTKTGATISGTTATAPDGAADCCTVTFTASASDSVMRTVASSADNVVYMTTVFARRTTGSGNVRLRVVKRDGVVAVSADLPISTTWTRIEYLLNWGTGATTPEVGIINDVAGTAQNVEVWGFDSKATLTFPTSYIRTVGANATRSADVLTFGSMPATMATGRWHHVCRPLYANAEGLAVAASFGLSSTLDSYSSVNSSVSVVSNGVTRFTRAVTFARNQAMTLTPDCGAFTMTVAGAATGDGTGAVGTDPTLATTFLRVGAIFSGARPAYQRIGEPYAG